MVAVGAQQKVAIALSNGEQAILGPHLGDMDTGAIEPAYE
jgi:hydrogenase maturation factor HypF (carbamoyltransferase family)